MSEKRMNDELAAIEAALGGLTPAPSGIQRDRLMFLAGRTSAARVSPPRGRRLRAWLGTCATAVSLLTAVTFGVLWAAGEKPEVVERVVYVPTQSLPMAFNEPAAAPPSPWGNRRLCQLILASGVDALPPAQFPSVAGAQAKPREDTNRNLLKELLNQPVL
jgi:hypothetical protein